MKKYVAVFSVAWLVVACGGTGKVADTFQQEDLQAKADLQGIWREDESEEPLLLVKGDSIFYASSQSVPITFQIMGDTLHTYGNDTTSYKIEKRDAYTFWFSTMSDNVVRLHKSDDLNDSLVFIRPLELVIPVYTEVTKRDSVVHYNATRFRAYVYINPSKMKVVKTTYTDAGLQVDNVYYDNVMHICVYEGKRCLFASDITRQMFKDVIPMDFLSQSILSDVRFIKVDKEGFHYQAILSIPPESMIYSIANLIVDFDGKLSILSAKNN